MLTPDYHHSIVNLVAALAGTQAPLPELYPPLAALAGARADSRPVALLVIDGLGDEFLARHPGSFLARFRRQRLTSVFPTTTAAAVTALALGVPALQHGIPGWFTYFRELGCIAAPLPFMPRGGGACFSTLGVSASQLLKWPPLLPGLKRPVRVATPAYISDSPYSRGLYGAVERRPHRDLDQFFQQLAAGLEEGGNPLVWGYWTELDALAHEFGTGSGEVREHFEAIDRGLAQLAERLAERDVLLLVTADHGLIDTDPGARLQLADHSELEEMLVLPLSGEPRAAFCHLRAGCEADFDAYCREVLGQVCEVFDTRALIEAGLFGLGAPAPGFRSRVGDRLLLPRDNRIIGDRLLTERPFSQVGVHGGLSAQELYVPLVVCEP